MEYGFHFCLLTISYQWDKNEIDNKNNIVVSERKMYLDILDRYFRDTFWKNIKVFFLS